MSETNRERVAKWLEEFCSGVEVSIVYPPGSDLPHLLIVGPSDSLGAVHHFYESFPEHEAQFGPKTSLSLALSSQDGDGKDIFGVPVRERKERSIAAWNQRPTEGERDD